MEQQAATLLATLKRPSAPSEAKVNLFNALKSDIKHYRVPETAQSTIFECIKLAVTQQASSTLASSALSTLGHLLKRLKIQDASGRAIEQLAPRLFPALQERIGDLREQVREAASQALRDLYPFCGTEVEEIIRDEAIGGSNARAKETGMRWVVRMHQDEGMPFKSYVSAMVARLEDADGTVRDAAKSVLVELFANAPGGAKTDLKRQMKAHSVRHAIESQILAQIGGSTPAARPADTEHEVEAEPVRAPRARPIVDHAAQFAKSLDSEAAQPPPQEAVPMDPIYAHTQRELEDIFRDMVPFFEGKEDEHNWQPRDRSILKIRRLLKGNAPNEFHHAFMAGIKSMVEGMIKTSNSLRTTMSTNGCQLVQELAKTLGPALDPHVEILLQAFIKMSAATKHIAAENGRVTADTIFQNCSYHVRMMQHIWNAAQEKNAQQRQCVSEWLRTILKRQTSYKHQFESSGGLDLAEKCIKKGLDDANPKVKEGTRTTYWTFAKGWPERADAIISKLDAKSRTALERDPNNPHAGLHNPAALAPPAARTGGASSSRSTLRELMAEQRKAKAAGIKVAERPSSAMADLSPVKKQQSHSSLRTAATSSSSRAPSNLSSMQRIDGRNPSTASNADPASGKKGSALMSGPVRRPRRVDAPRPQTADPYASKRLLRPETPVSVASPDGSPQRGTGASKMSVPTTNSTIRNRTRMAGDQGVYGTSPSGSISSAFPARRGGSPAITLNSSRPTSKGSITQSTAPPPFEDEENFTMILPQTHRAPPPTAVTRGREVVPPTRSPGHARGGLSQTMSVDNGILAMTPAEDDGLTLAHHASHFSQSTEANGRIERQRSPLAYRSPMRAMFDEARERTGKLSPEAQRALDLNGRLSPERANTPRDVAQKGMDEVQIYEDPFIDDIPRLDGGAAADQPGNDDINRKVLGELPVNENARQLASPTQSPRSRDSPIEHHSPRHDSGLRSSPDTISIPTPTASSGSTTTAADLTSSNSQDRTDILRNRRLLASGIERIRTRTLDAHGFRRVQDLAKSRQPELFEHGAKFDELVSVLLTYLTAAPSDAKLAAAPPARLAGLQTQALATLRAGLAVQRKFAPKWYAPALSTLLDVKRDLPSTASSSEPAIAHVAADLTRTADEIVAMAAVGASASACIDAVQDWLSSTPPDQPLLAAENPRAVAMALGLLRQFLLLQASATATAAAAAAIEPGSASPSKTRAATPPTPLNAEQKISLARTAARYLTAAEPEVRKADVEFASELFALFSFGGAAAAGGGKEAFWREFQGVEEGRLGLLTYYIAKRGRAEGGSGSSAAIAGQ